MPLCCGIYRNQSEGVGLGAVTFGQFFSAIAVSDTDISLFVLWEVFEDVL